MIPTRRHLKYATGYLALGMLTEASDELEAIEGEDRLLPEVLFVRCDLYMKAKQWDLLLAVSRELARRAPKHQEGWIGWANALRELNRVEEARAVLLEAERIHGKNCDVLHYNLACYACLLNDQAEAKRRLSMACKMGRKWKQTALDDPDLKAMWDDIAKIK
jgi:tetratricopeptide (TPR) repeat protein